MIWETNICRELPSNPPRSSGSLHWFHKAPKEEALGVSTDSASGKISVHYCIYSGELTTSVSGPVTHHAIATPDSLRFPQLVLTTKLGIRICITTV